MSRASSLKKARQAAAYILQEYHTRDLSKLYKYLGLSLYECPEFHDLKGMYAVVQDRPCVFIKSDLSPALRELVLAHELGHHLLHGELLEQIKVLPERSFFNFSALPELEANAFAADLLLEDSYFLDLAEAGNSLDQLAGAFRQVPELIKFKAAVLYNEGVPLRLPEMSSADFLLKT